MVGFQPSSSCVTPAASILSQQTAAAGLNGPLARFRGLQLQQGFTYSRPAIMHACRVSAEFRSSVHARCYLFTGGTGAVALPAAKRFYRPSRCAACCSASRDPDRVSLLSADEQLHSSGAPLSAHGADENTLPDTSSIRQAAISSNYLTSSSSSSSSKVNPRHSGFQVNAAELRAIISAAVDVSQTSAAEDVINTLTNRVTSRHQAKHARHAAKHPNSSNNDQDSVTSSGSTAAGQHQGRLPLSTALAAALHTDLQRGVRGDQADAAARVTAFGCNSLPVSATSSFWQLLLEAASDSTLLLLTAAGVVSLGLTAGTGKEVVDYIDGAAILASVAICVNVTAVTNYQKESKFRQLNSLKENTPVSGTWHI